MSKPNRNAGLDPESRFLEIYRNVSNPQLPQRIRHQDHGHLHAGLPRAACRSGGVHPVATRSEDKAR